MNKPKEEAQPERGDIIYGNPTVLPTARIEGFRSLPGTLIPASFDDPNCELVNKGALIAALAQVQTLRRALDGILEHCDTKSDGETGFEMAVINARKARKEGANGR